MNRNYTAERSVSIWRNRNDSRKDTVNQVRQFRCRTCDRSIVLSIVWLIDWLVTHWSGWFYSLVGWSVAPWSCWCHTSTTDWRKCRQPCQFVGKRRRSGTWRRDEKTGGRSSRRGSILNSVFSINFCHKIPGKSFEVSIASFTLE